MCIRDRSNIAEVGHVSEVFANPKSGIAKQLVFSQPSAQVPFSKRQVYRIVFDGRSSFEPVIANLVLECRAPVNILYADTRDIEGQAVGQMVIQLPEDELAAQRVLGYLKTHQIPYEEVEAHV